MELNNSYHVHDMRSLQMEKQRLIALCELQEHKLKAHSQSLQQNYMKMAMNSIIPFKGETKNKVSGAIELLNESILPALFGNLFNRRNDVTKNLMKIAQTVLISYSFKFFKNILSKKKKATIAE